MKKAKQLLGTALPDFPAHTVGYSRFTGANAEGGVSAYGYLMKLGEKGLAKTWKLRWFVIKGFKLYYYDEPKSPKEKGFIDFHAARAVETLSSHDGGGVAFQIKTDGRCYFLLACSADERKQWVDALNAILLQANPDVPRQASFAGATSMPLAASAGPPARPVPVPGARLASNEPSLSASGGPHKPLPRIPGEMSSADTRRKISSSMPPQHSSPVAPHVAAGTASSPGPAALASSSAGAGSRAWALDCETVRWSSSPVIFWYSFDPLTWSAERLSALVHVTNHRVAVTELESSTIVAEMPLTAILRVDRHSSYRRSLRPPHLYSVVREVGDTNRTATLDIEDRFIDSTVHVVGKLAATITVTFEPMRSFVSEFLEAVQVHSPASLPALFAFQPHQPKSARGSYSFDLVAEYRRLRLDSDKFQITDVNYTFSMCPSYPRHLVVPRDFPQCDLGMVGDFRMKQRIPACIWRAQDSCVSLWRCAQPKAGFSGQRNSYDERYMALVRSMSDVDQLVLFDARAKSAAIANKLAKGGGFEEHSAGYKNLSVRFLGIENIHAMREAFRKLMEQVHPMQLNDEGFLNAVSAWHVHLRNLLEGVVQVVELLHLRHVCAVIHCSDGWDRTSQLSALAQLVLDPYYRTIAGFMALVEKDWVSFGHKFADRCGHYYPQVENEQGPIFFQFCEAVYCLMELYPLDFEYNELLLRVILMSTHEARYGDFLCNSEKERDTHSVRQRTYSIWTDILSNPQPYRNLRYAPDPAVTVLPNIYSICRPRSISVWRQFYWQAN